MLSDPSCPLLPPSLLIVSKTEVDGAPRFEAAPEQIFNGLELPQHRLLVIDGTTTPDLAIAHHASKRVHRLTHHVLPAGALSCRNHVEMGVHGIGQLARVAALPLVHERELVDHLPLQVPPHQRETALEVLV